MWNSEKHYGLQVFFSGPGLSGLISLLVSVAREAHKDLRVAPASYRCHYRHYRPETIFTELLPAIWD